jgi:hypothetical protein
VRGEEMKVGDLVRGKFLTYGWYGVVIGLLPLPYDGGKIYEVNFGEYGIILQRANEIELCT